MTLTTTFKLLRKHDACKRRYTFLRKALKGIGDNEPINLLTILDHNGLDDAMWAMRATEQDCSKIGRLMAADFAESVLPIWTAHYPDDNRPALAIQAARDYASGLISTEVLVAAWDAAWDAAEGCCVGCCVGCCGGCCEGCCEVQTGRNLCVVPPAGKGNRMTRLDEIRHSAWQHRDLDITQDYAQGHEQPWASIRLR